MSVPLDTKLCQELASHIETLTHSGQKIIDAALMKKVKQLCRSNEGYLDYAYHSLLHQLQEQHAEVRYSAFQIIDELFRRSHCFRELVLGDLQRIMELTVETNSNNRLPPPKTVASNLKHLGLRSFHEWNAEYGSGYKRLKIGYNYLKKCKNIDFDNIEFENARTQESLRHQQIVNDEKIRKVLTEYSDLQEEIRNTMTSLENCIELLVPPLEEFFISSENGEDISDMPSTSTHEVNYEFPSEIGEDVGDLYREHGINPNFSVQVELKPVNCVKETDENTAIFENARDLQRLVRHRYIPRTKKWLQMLSKCSGKTEDIKTIVDMKESLEKCLKKCDTLKISTKGNDNSSESEFEEVPEKEGYEETVVEQLVMAETTKKTEQIIADNEKKEWSIFSKENNEKDPTTLLSTLNSLQSSKNLPSALKSTLPHCSTSQAKGKQEIERKKPAVIESIPSISGINHMVQSCEGKLSSATKSENIESIPSTSGINHKALSRKEKLLCVAPKLPFDIDLYHWEDEKLTAPTMLMVKPDGARFWSATSTDELEEIAVPEGAASLRTRVIEFSGQHEPVKWACRVPLPSGKLCPRRDRHKCPFHGPIIARDHTGKCSNPEDEARLNRLKEEEQQKTPDWQDPKLLQEIKEATGVDLKMPEKGKRKKKSDKVKYPGLTDIKAKQDNAYTRLSKKIFKKGTVKRVAQHLDSADHKRFRDKFGDQFNYIHETS